MTSIVFCICERNVNFKSVISSRYVITIFFFVHLFSGVVFTAVVLGLGLGTMASEKHRHKAQLMMRLRVGGQAFAIFAVLAGVYHNTKMGTGKKG